MFSFCKKSDDASASRKDATEVGWILDADSAGFIWEAPRKLTRIEGRTKHAKGVSLCPAANDHDARLYEVPCPFDLHLGIKLVHGEAPELISLDGPQSSLRANYLKRVCSIVSPREWRQPNRPIIQFLTPYLFVADEPVYISQVPPYYHYAPVRWPGTLIGGRFPIDVWPRGLVWAFEWFDVTQPIVIKRGDPWFYVSFETQDPTRRIRLIEAEMTPELTEYTKGILGVTNYVRNTYSLFDTARSRRPKTLLVPKKR